MLTHTYKINTGMRCIKYMLLVINFMFMLTATLLIMVGTTIQAIFGDFKEYIAANFFSPPILLVIIGCFMLMVSIFGCYGAIKESTMLINIYGVFLFLIFILEVLASFTALLLQVHIPSALENALNSTFSHFEANEYIEKSVNFVQYALECCGVYKYSDWKYFLKANDPTSDNFKIPKSCCAPSHIYNNSTFEEYECEAYESGCLHKMVALISSSAMLIACGAIAVAFVQLLGSFCALMLAKTIRRNKSLREARRWQLQQSLGIFDSNENNIKNSNEGYTKLSKTENENNTEPEPITYTATSPSVN